MGTRRFGIKSSADWKIKGATDYTDSTEIILKIREISAIRGFFVSAFRVIRSILP
jgi:hypothetical protein